MIIINGEKWYTVQEAAAILDVEPPSIQRYISNGRIKPQKIESRNFITETELKNYVNGGKNGRRKKNDAK